MIVIAHNIRSLHNVGAIFRSADAFGVERLYLTGYTAAPPRKEIAKTALGSEDRVVWEKESDVMKVVADLQAKGVRVLALETSADAIPLPEARKKFDPARTALILGNEVSGLEKELLSACEGTVQIPMPGKKRSLNVSVASGIALFAFCSENG